MLWHGPSSWVDGLPRFGVAPRVGVMDGGLYMWHLLYIRSLWGQSVVASCEGTCLQSAFALLLEVCWFPAL